MIRYAMVLVSSLLACNSAATAETYHVAQKHQLASDAKPSRDHLVRRGVTVRHAANTAQRGALFAAGDHWLVEDCIVEWTNGSGISFRGDNVTFRRVRTHHNGQQGLGGGGRRFCLEEVTLDHNNLKGFDQNVYFIEGKQQLALWGCPWRPKHRKYADLAAWQKDRGEDGKSLAADPRFVAPDSGDWTLRKDSPAPKLRAGPTVPPVADLKLESLR